MFRQEERTKSYLPNVIKGLAGDETNMSNKEEKRKLLITQRAQGSVKRRERPGWKRERAVKGGARFCQIVTALNSKELERLFTAGGIWQLGKPSPLLSVSHN